MKLFIKNMVCKSCKMLVQNQLEKIGLVCTSVEIGMIETLGDISQGQMIIFKGFLTDAGMELIDDRKSILIEKIKKVVIDLFLISDTNLKTNFSDYLSVTLNLDYTYMANTFSEVSGYTIEHFIIQNKIQRVKQLIGYNELNLTQISWKLNYSSVAHLSTQFKKVTGVTPSHFKHFDCNSALAGCKV